MKNINMRLDELTNKIINNELLSKNGLGNEINFHILDYDPLDEYEVREYLNNYLSVKFTDKVKVVNIYKLIIDILEENGFLEKVFEYEKTKGVEYVNNLISKTLGISNNGGMFVEKIKKEIEEDKIIILTGISECFGIIRGHTILNKLHSLVTDNPLIMCYPGSYNGQSLKLFNKLENDNYYRAFPLVGRN